MGCELATRDSPQRMVPKHSGLVGFLVVGFLVVGFLVVGFFSWVLWQFAQVTCFW